MSRLALLIGASPLRCLEGPVVRLPIGTHILHIEHIVDSELIILVEGYECSNVIWHGMKLHLPCASDVKVNFSKRGSEKFINVTAERAA